MFFMNVNLLSHHSLELTGYHSEFNIEDYILLKSTPICESCPVMSKVPGSELGLVGVRAFESHP